MKKAGILLGLLLMLGLNYQCTEDDEVEAHVAKVNMIESDSGEEGDQESDTSRD